VQFEEFTLSTHAAPHKNEWTVEAYRANNMLLVATAEFVGVYEHIEIDEFPGYEKRLVALKGWNVEVNPKYRRRGLATAMYNLARETWGLPIERGDFLTEEGEAFRERGSR
jgi:GNAT superfamily N-acetyltransferase